MPTNYQSGGSFLPEGDINFKGTNINFQNVPTFGTASGATGGTGAMVTTNSTQTLTNKTLTSPTIVTPAISGATIVGTVTVATGATLTNPTLTGAALAGTITATGATISQPGIVFTVAAMTATGTTGANAAPIVAASPALITVTGAANSGVILPTGATPGQAYWIKNKVAGTIKVYAQAADLINGVSGNTGVSVTTTGSQGSWFVCVTAQQWEVAPLIT